jgi:hypothetical protein
MKYVLLVQFLSSLYELQFFCNIVTYSEPGSSGSIVSGYGLDDQVIGVRFLAEAKKDFSPSFCVQTGSRAHPASCTMGTAGSFSGAKARSEHDADHSPPSSAEVETELELYLSPQVALAFIVTCNCQIMRSCMKLRP